ncbi:hypothetical protein [Deinococcus alpinitundrae]|uniref:hypothetical protein n=1 Tax=Deinococcus alpinitundrae TaxID=468913 RepID=UPI00137B834B|nr:hypothetical protein [Deinococcus alpinitundrae]
MDEKPMYLIDGLLVHGLPATREDATEDLDDAVRNAAKFWNVTVSELLVLKEVAIAISGIVQEMAFMVIPKSRVSAICLPPYSARTGLEFLKQKGLAPEIPLSPVGAADRLEELAKILPGVPTRAELDRVKAGADAAKARRKSRTS